VITVANRKLQPGRISFVSPEQYTAVKISIRYHTRRLQTASQAVIMNDTSRQSTPLFNLACLLLERRHEWRAMTQQRSNSGDWR